MNMETFFRLTVWDNNGETVSVMSTNEKRNITFHDLCLDMWFWESLKSGYTYKFERINILDNGKWQHMVIIEN